ncbi:Nse1 non-SMC component of SMC5-6 complex-domain-containing protein [Infundibulicybe gibba]|nr:Nse1 non-SMC component of SMC5-6 complex-domain-containing protein [Infundibulicybe gibba]
MVSSNDVQRLFLQAVLSRRVLSGKLAQLLWSKCIAAVKAADDTLAIPESTSKEAWGQFLTKVNASLNDLDLEFQRLQDETTGWEMYALINRKGDAIAQMATDYTPGEIAYFKVIVEQVMLAPRESYSVSSLAALREVASIKPKSNMSKAQAEVVLGSFVAQGWLLKSKRGRYSLSARSLLELMPYLKSTYPDELIECTICMEVMTRGIACSTANCKTRMHFHCFSTFRRRQEKCPSCKAQWPERATDSSLIPIGEGAVKDGQDDGKRRVRIKSVEASDEEEAQSQVGEDEEEETEELSQPTKRAPSQRNKGKARADASMDVDEAEGKPPAPSKTQGKRRSSRR